MDGESDADWVGLAVICEDDGVCAGLLKDWWMVDLSGSRMEMYVVL